MRTLYLTNLSPWPVDAGCKVRMNGVSRGISHRHELINVLVSDRPNIRRDYLNGGGVHVLDSEPAPRSQRLLDKTHPGDRRHLRPKGRHTFRRSFLRLCDELKPDAVYCFQSPTLWRVGPAPEGIPLLFDIDDVESKKRVRAAKGCPPLTRLSMMIDSLRIRRAEREMLNASQVVLLSNPDDAPYVRSITSAPLVVVPNGFAFPDRLDFTPRRSKQLAFYGMIAHQQAVSGLVWFLDEVWPMIRRVVPDAHFEIAGRYIPKWERLNSIPGVTLHGFLDDLAPFVKDSAFLVVPLHCGAGTRIKLLEAWSRGLPVVSTSVGCEGLNAVDGETVLIGDSAKEFAARCVELLGSPEMGVRLAANAFEHGKRLFDWESIFPKIDEAMDTAARLRVTT